MDNRKELNVVNKKIDKLYNKFIKPLEKEKSILREKVEKEKCESLLGKTFVYKDNSYSCPSKKSDYWNNYMKVVKVGDYGVDCLIVSKDSYGRIQIEIERLNEDLMGYSPCSKSSFERNYEKLLKEIEKLNDVIENKGVTK